MNSKTTPVVLVMFTLVFALPAAGAIPAAIAQEAQEEDASLGAGLARSLVPDVLDGGGDDEEENGDAVDDEIDQDSTDTATVNPNQEYNNEANFAPQNNNPVAIPIIDQDQGAANLAAQLAANLDVNSIPSSIPTNPTIPECPPGFTLNNNGQCERTVTQDPECPIGFTFNPATDLCESSTVPQCTAGEFNPATDQCGIAPQCTESEFNPETDQCEQRQTQAPT